MRRKQYQQGLFITGTDTDVGKTYVACGIANELRERGIDVGVMKPVETGCRSKKGVLVPADALALAQAAAVKDPLDLVNPYRFRNPLAPAVAASLEGNAVRIERIRKAFRELQKRHGSLLVEGAGGILVPLTRKLSFIDLAKMLDLPVLVVARPGLGTINHTLLTLAALRTHGVPIAGVVINHALAGKSGLAERTSPAVIEKRSGVPLLGTVRHDDCDFSGICDSLLIQKH